MAESSSYTPTSPPIIPKEEPITLDRLDSPQIFSPADQVKFNLDEMLLQTNNEVSQCLGGKTGGFDQISYKDATILYCLANRLKVDFAKIIWDDLLHKLNKKSREKIIAYPIFISLLIQYMAPKYHKESLKISPTETCPMFPKLQVPPHKLRQRFPMAQSLELKLDSEENNLLKSNTEVPTFETGHSKTDNMSSPAMDSNPAYPSASTPVNAEMHKEDQQATSGLTSLGATSEDRAHPHLNSGMYAFIHINPEFLTSLSCHSESASGHDSSAASTAEADPGTSASNDSMPNQQCLDKGLTSYSPDHIFAGTNPGVLVAKTKSMRDGSQTAHMESGTKHDFRSAFFDDDEEEDEPV
ncbi:hypothetical protein Tco_1151331, partial [Tanacetum coccineum]